MQAIDELVARWRNNPDCESTLALCAHLSTSPEDELLREVGESAETWHHDNASVMLSVGRMYLDTGRLSDAQAALVHSGKLDPKNPEPYRYLGEVLLRRGNAARCEKVLRRAIRLGSRSDETQLWAERASVYVELQRRQGAEAVAREVERTSPLIAQGLSSDVQTEGTRSTTRRSRPPPAAARTGNKRRSAPPGARRRAPASSPPPVSQQVVPHSGAKLTEEPMPTLYGVGAPPSADSLRAAAHALGTLPESHSPKSLLDTLAEVGLFEPNSGLTPAWEAPPAVPTRRPWVLGGAALVLIAAGLSGYQLSESARQARRAQAQIIATALSDELSSANLKTLKSSEEDFKALFELDSRNHQAALLWLENRVIHALLDADAVTGIETALSRARTVGVPEADMAFGIVASSLANGEWKQAIAHIKQWDNQSTENGLFQLLAGAALEGAGDPLAIDRYRAAVKLLPDNKVAHLHAARLSLLQTSGTQPDPLVAPALSRLAQSPAALVLQALAQASRNDSKTKIELDLKKLNSATLPATLAPVANAVNGVARLQADDPTDALLYFGRALRGGSSPALALWIGNRALAAGLLDLARRATLQASAALNSGSGLQNLAARVALAAGDLGNAEKAAKGLPPNSPAIALTQVVAAYEGLQWDRLKSLLDTAEKTQPVTGALRSGIAVARGKASRRLTPASLAQGQQAWSSVIAVDLALDRGDLAFAHAQLPKLSSNSLEVAARRARLLRLEGQPAAALSALSPILADSPQSPRQLVETVLTLVASKKLRTASKTLASAGKRAATMAPWLRALIAASSGSRRSAKNEIKKLPLPSRSDSLLVQTLSLSTLAASGDRRAKQLYNRLASRHASHPDVIRAGRSLGLAR